MTTFISKKVLVSESYGWHKIEKNDLTLWFKGYLHNSNVESVYSQAVYYLSTNNFDINILSKWSKSLNGHFALIIITADSIFAAVDKVNTTPLFYCLNKDVFFISNKASLIKDRISGNHHKINHQASLEIAMSGYTIGRKTIYDDLFQLTAGECLFFEKGSLNRVFYYTYSPWKVKDRSERELIKDLNSILNATMSELVDSIQGKQVVIPLSAGNDSRLIASGLKHFGVDNVLCFSYGIKGNFESKMASLIAHKLGYDWKHIDINVRNKKKFFKSKKYKAYIDNYDSYSSIPAVQDIVEICHLKQENLISKDAIIINGSGGDYISGGHLFQMSALGVDTWEQFLIKHYSLWSALKTDTNSSLIIKQLEEIIEERNFSSLLNNNDLPFLFEALEYLGRQSMYVVNQQEAYDFNNFDWRLPLWSDNFLSFWETVPFEYKIRQKLYSKVLYENNWGGVWQGMPINDKKIHPNWIRILRFVSKICLSPLGKENWHSFEKKIFQYWMDLTRNSVITPYHKVLLDNNGQKNTFSWISKEYLEQNNINIPFK